jgi:hypothetical protein
MNLKRLPGAIVRRVTEASQRAFSHHRPDTDDASIKTFQLRLNANPKHPTIQLFMNRKDAAARAAELGAPWVPVTYACGYILTDGWNFCDAEGKLDTFCPVTLEQLDRIVSLVSDLKVEQVPAGELPRRIAAGLKPLEAGMPKAAFESMCLCAMMRVGYAMPNGAADDWLTTPPWALRIPKRRMRLT